VNGWCEGTVDGYGIGREHGSIWGVCKISVLMCIGAVGVDDEDDQVAVGGREIWWWWYSCFVCLPGLKEETLAQVEGKKPT